MSGWIVVRLEWTDPTLGHRTFSQFDEFSVGSDQSDLRSDEANGRSPASARYCHYAASRWQALASVDPIPNQEHYSAARRALKKFDSSYFFAGYNQPKLRRKFLFLRKFLCGWRALDNDLLEKRID